MKNTTMCIYDKVGDIKKQQTLIDKEEEIVIIEQENLIYFYCLHFSCEFQQTILNINLLVINTESTSLLSLLMFMPSNLFVLIVAYFIYWGAVKKM